jgi:hypothetical protein
MSSIPPTIADNSSSAASAWSASLLTRVRDREFGIVAAATSLLVVACYVFIFTPYEGFVFSDMNRFWQSAIARLDGDEFSDAQFIAWPPLYHIFLAELFRVFRAIGLDGLIRLETALMINIFAFAVSVYAFHRLATHWFTKPAFVLIAVLLYAIGFPSLYFNAFLLSGNLGGPLLVMATAIVATREHSRSAVIGALLFGLATLIRPSFGPYGLAFVALYLARHGIRWIFVRRAAMFSAVFFAIVLLGSAEVARISGGKVFGLSGNGGLDFFIASSDYHKVDVEYDGWHFMVVVPAYSYRPENGTFYTNVPFYKQDYYFNLGWEALKRDPSQVWKNFRNVRNLFFAPMLPSRSDAPGFETLMPVWDWIKFAMFMLLGLYIWTWRSLGSRAPVFWLLINFVTLTAIVAYFFTGEPRYTYAIMFAFYLLALKLVELLADYWRQWGRALGLYAVTLLVAGAATAAVLNDPYYPPTVAVELAPEDEPSTGPAPPFRTKVGRVLFPYTHDIGLDHVRRVLPLTNDPVRVRMRTRAQVTGTDGLPLRFEIYSAWPFELRINGHVHVPLNRPLDYFEEFVTEAILVPGVHDIDVVFHYAPAVGGFAVAYSYWDGDWRTRKLLGVTSDRVRFLTVTQP